jgi:RES domain-containing protein
MSDESKNVTIRVAFPFKDMQVWQRFVVDMKSKNRFTLSEEPARFVDLLIDYAKKHKAVSLPRSTLLYRARINDTDNNTPFALDKMSAPPAHLAGHGRLNPRGIPYLYLASDTITAISEVRPWVGCELTVAEFCLVDECELINFSKKHLVNVPRGDEFDGAEFTWRELITWMFSAPFDPRDDTAYIPTQYLTERIKGAGFVGIMYDSALSTGGYNVALFDAKRANTVRRERARVTATIVDARFDEIVESQG